MIQNKIIFLGSGFMAGAMIRGLTQKKIVAPEHIYVLGKSHPQKMKQLVDDYGVNTAAIEDIAKADIVFLAFKPQNLEEAMTDYSPYFSAKQLILSILAGTSTAKLEEKVPGAPVVRLMPNLALSVGLSATGYCLGKNAGKAHAALTEALFSPLGKIVRVEENQMSDVTALSGSGPAYFYYLTEAMIAAAIESGINPDSAQKLAVQTLIGTAKLIADSGETPEEMRRRITSKGGTTEAALKAMAEADFMDVVQKGYLACRKRSDELGK